ncbi:MAG TPA: holo-ACP synthase [Solirubrobacteraceae bacterium]|nr:holo-ACP synthase [Solirubrobacteraceae bacterium]
MTRSVGIDLADVEEVRESVRAHGERYLKRVFTDAERRDCGTSARRLAQCFAAKEATMKALACRERLPWHSVTVGRDAAGQPAIVLSGPAAQLARERGVQQLAVSFSGAGAHAVAVVVVVATSGG